MRDRVRLFEAVVTPTALYGSSTWALTKSMEHQLFATRRKILRYVFRIHRRRIGEDADAMEDWVDFVRRAAHRVDELSAEMGMGDWIDIYRKRKWRFAGKQARAEDGRWSLKVLQRRTEGYARDPGRPKTRWADQIERFAGGDWMTLALDEDRWDFLTECFANVDDV